MQPAITLAAPMNKKLSFFYNLLLLTAYLLLVMFAMRNHELWGDELHSWNIVKGSHSWGELFRNIRYEGHPPFWYCYLFIFTSFSHSLFWLKAAQFTFTALAAIALVFFSPFSRLQKVLLLGGYYFLFEYALLARNYMPAIFFAFCIAALFNSTLKYKMAWYTASLFALSQVHLLGLLLGMSIHAGFCYRLMKAGRSVAFPVVSGIAIMAVSLYFILPPSDSQMNFQFWMDRWSVSKLYLFVTVVVKSLVPLMEWFNPHWWNSHYFLDNNSLLFRLISLMLFAGLLLLIYFSAHKSRTAFVIVVVNMSLTFLLSLVFPLNSMRYTGFVFIGLVVAAWISFGERESAFSKKGFVLLLLLQVPSGIIALSKDAKENFSSAWAVSGMNLQVPKGAFVATDYWSLNSLSAYLDTSFYCIEPGRIISFLTWNSEMRAVLHFNYTAALEKLAIQNQGQSFYFYSMLPLTQLYDEHQPGQRIRMEFISESGFSVEKSGRIYLYKVKSL